MENLKALGIMLLLLFICCLGCQDPVPYHADAGADTGADTTPLPAPQACLITDTDRANSIGVGVCTDDAGNPVTFHDAETGFDVKCYRCSGEFNAQGTEPVPAEGCFVWRHSQPIAGLCVNSCKQCGSSRDGI